MSDQADDMFKLVDMVQEHNAHVAEPFRSILNSVGHPTEQVAEEMECEECGHGIKLHKDPYGCQYERGDAWVTGNQPSQPTVLMAQGPCGCELHGFTPEEAQKHREYVDEMRLANLERQKGCNDF